jgi:hypothetical protein
VKTIITIIILIIINFFLIFKCNAQGHEFEWAKQFGVGRGSIFCYIITTDSKGNVFTVGQFAGTLDFDPGPDTFNLNSVNDGWDIFITKYSTNGNLLWVKQIRGSGLDGAKSITTDVIGNVFVTGYFGQGADFDPGTSIYNLISHGNQDIFILKLDANGNFIWAKQFGGIGHDFASSIKTDLSGNICIIGSFNDKVDFDPGKDTFFLISSIVLSNFILKLDANGKLIWVKQIDEGYSSWLNCSVVFDASGDIYSTGFFSGTVDFDPGPDTFILSAPSNTYGGNIFILKLDSKGNFVWAKHLKSNDSSFTYGFKSIEIDVKGNIYTTGSFSGKVDFNPGTEVFNLTSRGSRDIFILKLDKNGNFIWVDQIGGIDIDEGYSITTDTNGNVFSTGYFHQTVDFDPGEDSFNQTASNSRILYILKLDSAGDFTWVKQIGGLSNSYDNNFTITTDSNGNLYTIGAFRNTVDFDPGPNVYNLTSGNSNFDLFILKLKPCKVSYSTLTDSSCSDYSLNERKYSLSGVYRQYFTNITGCDSILTLNLTINNVDLSVSESDTVLSSNESDAAYQWIDCNNQFASLPGATNRSLVLQDNGSYAVIVTKNGCTDTSECNNISFFKQNIRIYPNPTPGKFYIDFGIVCSTAKIIITDVLGRIVTSNEINEVKITKLNIDKPAGVYFVSIVIENIKETYKVVVQ